MEMWTNYEDGLSYGRERGQTSKMLKIWCKSIGSSCAW